MKYTVNLKNFGVRLELYLWEGAMRVPYSHTVDGSCRLMAIGMMYILSKGLLLPEWIDYGSLRWLLYRDIQYFHAKCQL